MKKYTDEAILNVIEKILKGEGENEDLDYWLSNELSSFMPGISDLIFYSKEKLTPEQVLKKARELSKQILL